LPSGAWQSVPFGAPLSRMRRVSARLSTPVMAGRSCAFSQPSRFEAARKFDGSVMSARMTAPQAAGVMVSISSILVPTLPIWGKVKVMICPA
jgi:hypothetical protein